MTLGDVGIGNTFRYNGGVFVALCYDYDKEGYPYICIASRNPKYDEGTRYFFTDDIKIDELITIQRLRNDFIPKGIDYEME